MIIDFQQSRNIALGELKLLCVVSVLNANEKRENRLEVYPDVWLVTTEIFNADEEVKIINLLFALPEDFPLVLPKVYISSSDYEWIKYIPHVNTVRNICLFDDETINANAREPGNIIKECLHRAQQIIENGLKQKNAANFTDEFIAYWESVYDPKDKVLAEVNLIAENLPLDTTSIKFLYLKKNFRGYKILLHGEDEDFAQFKNFLTNYEFEFDEHDAFFLGEIKDLAPPFIYSNKNTYEIINNNFSHLLKKFEHFINKPKYPKLVLFSITIKEKALLFGWAIEPLNVTRDGFRPGTLSPMNVYKTFQKSDRVTRFKFDIFTKTRMHERSEGIQINEYSCNLTIAGLGSIGSNLLPYLLPLNPKNIELIDPDILLLENSSRHLLGIESIKEYKVDGIKRYLEMKNPLLKINVHKTSVIKIIRNQVEVLNNSDYIFVAIGKDNIEEYIFDAINSGILIKPVFFLWVEPYLCGGHCLFISPKQPANMQDLYTDQNYNYNIIDSSEYHDDSRQMFFREAGCQSSYLAYGQKNILLFLSRLIPFIYDTIESKAEKSLRFTWKGNRQTVEKLKLKMSQTGNKIDFGEMQTSEI